jgi:hypothetical protein
MSADAARLGIEPDLLAKMSTLPDGKLLEALDVLAAVAELPDVRRLINDMRPRLRKLQPRRAPTLKRVLFQPVEDLFASGAPRPGSPSIPRSAIALCWSLLEQREPQQMSALAAALRALPRDDPRAILPLAHELWSLAAGVVAAAEKEGAVDEAVALIGRILVVASEVQAFKRALPQKPMTLHGNARALQLVKEGVEAIKAKGVAIDGFILAVAARLESPAELFRTLQTAEIPLPASAAKLLGAYVIDEVVKEAKELADTSVISPEDAARDADRLFRVLTDAQNNLGGKMKNELNEGTRHVDGVIKGLLGRHVIEPATTVIAAALGRAGAPANDEDLVAAEAHARALARSRQLAKHVGLDAAANAAVIAIRDQLKANIGQTLETGGATRDKDAVRKTVFGTIRLLEMVAGPEEAERLLRQAQKHLSDEGAKAAPGS